MNAWLMLHTTHTFSDRIVICRSRIKREEEEEKKNWMEKRCLDYDRHITMHNYSRDVERW